ncbi:iron-containing redox enzyme family protein [Kineosporiaceae bacterium SCSIO 59966]|nr:iron-containing redox enzyme family protein [Kineosporiaceae bacterium SCSIO 59966]
MRIPSARGPFTAALVDILGERPHEAAALSEAADAAGGRATARDGVLADDDVQLGLTLLYELSYRGLAGVDDAWEWSPSLIAARGVLESAVERELLQRFGQVRDRTVEPEDVPAELFAMTSSGGGPSVAGFVAREATVGQVREMCVLRSAYQLKEADPHTWSIPRLHGAAKSALVEIQFDEYGEGRPGRMHSELFAATMRAVGLDDAYGAYVDLVPARTLATVNAMHLFGLHRRWRGANLGHLAAYEMTSSLPCKRYAAGMERLGLPPEAAEFFTEHVEADAVHEQLAAHDLCGSLVAAEPALTGDVLFGAAVCLGLDELAGAATLAAWQAGRSALRRPVRIAATAATTTTAGTTTTAA